MDTNQQNRQDNYQINTFIGGMNTDTSYDMVLSNLYLFGLNIRITNNTLIGEKCDSNTKENIVTPVPTGTDVNYTVPFGDTNILACASIENVGVVISNKGRGTCWNVYRMELKDNEIHPTLLFTSTNATDKDRFSIVMHRELEGCIKVYIADGIHQIMCINIEDIKYYTAQKFTEDDLISNHLFPLNQIEIAEKISGQLKTQQVQYTYRLYKKHGIYSKLAPVTGKIQIIDPNRNKETGNAEDTLTSIGLRLNIKYTQQFRNVFDHIQVFRLSYIKHNQNAEVHLICDNKLPEELNFVLNDTGTQSLTQYSIDEFSAITGQTIIPQVLELNQGYLFCGNVVDQSVLRIPESVYDAKSYSFNKDKQVVLRSSDKLTEKQFSDIKYITDDYYINDYSDINDGDKVVNPCKYTSDGKTLGGTGKNISWEFITHSISADYTELKRYFKTKNITADFKCSYDDIFVSSFVRSLGRNEVYRYGIVFYDQYGVRSDVLWIADIRTPDYEESSISVGETAKPIGIKFTVKQPANIEGHDIIAYQIVRCEKSNSYTKNLLQCALSRPLRQGKYGSDTYRTPYYPNMFISTQFFYTMYGINMDESYKGHSDLYQDHFNKAGTNVENFNLFQIFSPNILFQRETTLSDLTSSDVKLSPLYYAMATSDHDLNEQLISDYSRNSSLPLVLTQWNGSSNVFDINQLSHHLHWYGTTELEKTNNPICRNTHKLDDVVYLLAKYQLNWNKSDKVAQNLILRYNSKTSTYYANRNKKLISTPVNIKHIADVKNPTWEQGFSDIQLSGATVISAIKQYKSFRTSIGSESYVNWVCNGMYDLPATRNEAESTYGNEIGQSLRVFAHDDSSGEQKNRQAYGWIGPGPVCLLINIEPFKDTDTTKHVLNNHITYSGSSPNNHANFGTMIASIQHTAVLFAGITSSEKQYDLYYGFGNFGTFTDGISTLDVFDGDKYITPCEFTSIFKTYNFNDREHSIISGLVVNYIMLESNINTYFDYGMNYKNTSNLNLQLEPGAISGVASQDRALHQYNMIYSDNSTSNDVFSAQSIEKQTEKFPQRIFYSSQKENGEAIDNWSNFKPADFIDTDTRYGQVTNLLTVNDTLYYWLNSAFGRLSVNERSLIKDENSNTILLGQGGVLQRTDYLSTRYGMREQDFAAISAEDGVFWVDMINKALIACSSTNVLNYGEALNVQNLINENITENRPLIHYDILNQELLCNMLSDNRQLITNLKLKVATSVYTRNYLDILQFNNVMFGLQSDKTIKYNFLDEEQEYLYPTVIKFVVNSVATQTKVFDNQKIVTLKRKYDESFATTFMDNKVYAYETDLYDYTKRLGVSDLITDREGNICYPIPRWSEENGYGQRMRGKWMAETITDYKPSKEFTISNIITKFRQSFS